MPPLAPHTEKKSPASGSSRSGANKYIANVFNSKFDFPPQV
jgi:hypothetical protein